MKMAKLGGGATFAGIAALLAGALGAAPALAQDAPPPAAPPAGAPIAPMQPAAPPGIVGMPAGYSPPRLEWNKGDPVPQGYHPTTEARTGFVIAGGVTLGVSWAFGGLLPGIAGLAACSGSNSGSCSGTFGVMLIPALGPFIAMGVLAGDKNSSNAGVAYAILAIDGSVQALGAALLIYGLASQRDVLVRNDIVGKTNVRWTVRPMAMGKAGQGVGVLGTF
jgi:hypothetical protein